MTSFMRIAVTFMVGAVLFLSAPVAAQDAFGGFNANEPVIKELPYSGIGVTMVKLTMFDGTKTGRSVVAKLWRDSAGRTRREQAIVGLEALDPTSDLGTVVHIVDPVAGVLFTLNPGTRTADRLPLTMFKGGLKPLRVPLEYPKKDVDLGVKDIDGLSAKGTRTITTVPAGAAGNDRPIEIIDERWESVELKVLVRSLHRDPRTGDIEYALTKISRMEPPASMFTVPAGYTIREPLGQNSRR